MALNLGQNLFCERSILFDLFELLFLTFSKDFFRGTRRSANSVLFSLQVMSEQEAHHCSIQFRVLTAAFVESALMSDDNDDMRVANCLVHLPSTG